MGCRTKFVSVLVVYGAGFATAVYCLAPAPEPTSREPLPIAGLHAAINSEEFARSVNSGMHKCIDFSKEAARQTAQLIREKIDRAKASSNQ
jgi:hypothetical protein